MNDNIQYRQSFRNMIILLMLSVHKNYLSICCFALHLKCSTAIAGPTTKDITRAFASTTSKDARKSLSQTSNRDNKKTCAGLIKQQKSSRNCCTTCLYQFRLVVVRCIHVLMVVIPFPRCLHSKQQQIISLQISLTRHLEKKLNNVQYLTNSKYDMNMSICVQQGYN